MIEIKKNIYWTGIKDWNLRAFHGHALSTFRGSSYNSYLIRDRDKTVLVDTVWEPYKDEFVNRLEREVGLANIDAIVVNHCETDHGGSLTCLMERIPGTPVYCTKNGAEMIKKHHHKEWDFHIVKTGDSILTGEYELVFVEMQMLHWPDSMLTYVKGANLVLSNDAFGQHYASSSIFNDESDECEIFQEAMKYYANILTPYSAILKKKLEQISALNLPIDMIAPSHGIIWRKDPMKIVEKYAKWADNYNEGTVAVIYETMWNGTAKMAAAIAEGVAAGGKACRIIDAAVTDKNEIITEVFKAKGLVIGSPTVNNGLLPSIGMVLEEIKSLKFKDKAGAAFGCFGWSGEGPGIITRRLEESGTAIIQEPIRFKYNPTADELQQCVEFGKAFAAGLKSDIKSGLK